LSYLNPPLFPRQSKEGGEKKMVRFLRRGITQKRENEKKKKKKKKRILIHSEAVARLTPRCGAMWIKGGGKCKYMGGGIGINHHPALKEGGGEKRRREKKSKKKSIRFSQ